MGLEPLDSLSFLFKKIFLSFLLEDMPLLCQELIVFFGTGEQLDMTFSGSLWIKDNSWLLFFS